MGQNSKIQEKRIEQVFSNKFSNLAMRPETIIHYKSFLEANLVLPVKLTGIEDFSWEEFYVLGPGDQLEYKMLKQTHPSYTDTYNMTKISTRYDKFLGLLAKVTRLGDKKKFELPLADLKAVDKKSNEYLLLHDYSVWAINYL